MVILVSGLPEFLTIPTGVEPSLYLEIISIAVSR
jgi:hypothetical protein